MEKKNITYWSQALQEMPQSYLEWFNEERKFLEENIAHQSNVLEVGCGNGRSVFDLISNTNNITGIDHDENAVAEAQNIFSEYPSVTILQASAEEMPFADASFDHIICMTTFANFADKKHKILCEMKRVLRESGSIIISVFSEDALQERMKVYQNVGVRIEKIEGGRVTFDKSLGAHVSEQFSQKELTEIFTRAGLCIVDIKKVGIAYLCLIQKK